MQPTIILSAPAAGIIHINGRFAGEASAQRPLVMPVSPFGALYLEYLPLSGGAAPMARRCVFSGGALLADSVAEADGLACVAWPGGAVEIEMTPPDTSVETFFLEGRPCRLARGARATLSLGGLAISLPATARAPRMRRFGGQPALLGDTDGGQYLVTLSPDMAAQTGFLAAERIDFASDDMLNAVVSLGDSVGHGRLEQWIADAGGLRCVSSEPVWSAGAPRWPRTAEGAMIAAVEAAMAGLPAEAQGYLASGFAAARPLEAVAAECDLCAPMKYAVPDARPCVALLTAVNDHLAVARPLYYRAVEAGSAQGPWRIEWMGAE